MHNVITRSSRWKALSLIRFFPPPLARAHDLRPRGENQRQMRRLVFYQAISRSGCAGEEKTRGESALGRKGCKGSRARKGFVHRERCARGREAPRALIWLLYTCVRRLFLEQPLFRASASLASSTSFKAVARTATAPPPLTFIPFLIGLLFIIVPLSALKNSLSSFHPLSQAYGLSCALSRAFSPMMRFFYPRRVRGGGDSPCPRNRRFIAAPARTVRINILAAVLEKRERERERGRKKGVERQKASLCLKR